MSILQQRQQQLDREMAVIETQTADNEKIMQSRLTLAKFVESLDKSSAELTVEEKQRVIRALIDEIIVFTDSIKIRHCIPVGCNAENRTQKCPLQNIRSFKASPLIRNVFPAFAYF